MNQVGTKSAEARAEEWRGNLQDERDGAALYEGMARHEPDRARASRFLELAEAERRHAAVWERKLREGGLPVPPDRPSARVRSLLWLARRFGAQAVLHLVAEAEATDAAKYEDQGGEALLIAAEERDHQRTLGSLRASGGEPSGARELIAAREHWHRGGGRAGSIRAAIFGMNDGLLSNLSLIVGVAGAGAAPRTVLVTGLAGLLAGAFSMAAGEYTSVASQRDLLARQVDMERREIAQAPEDEAAELALILQGKGLPAEQARSAATTVLQNPDAALDTLVREELGLDPSDLGSPVAAALSSFAMFAVGAALPILPFLLLTGAGAVVFSAALAFLVLAIVGGLVGFLSGLSVWRSAARMVGLAVLAAGVTYAVGRLFGATVS